MTTSAEILISSKSVEHYTPPEIVEAARATMGGIDYDPASCAKANEIVRARAFSCAGQNTLDIPWSLAGAPTRVFLNPPGGKLHRETFQPIGEKDGPGWSAAAVWFWKLVDEWQAGHVAQAIFVCFSLSVFQNSQQFEYPAPYSFPFVVPAQRLRFWNERTPIGKGAPQHCNAIVYLPPQPGTRYTTSMDRTIAVDGFARAFAPFGAVRI